jgi:hypothetical protein
MVALTTDESDDTVPTVVEEIASREGVDFTELPPLSRTVDGDALTKLLRSADGTDLTVEFSYCGYEVTVHGDGRVTVTE